MGSDVLEFVAPQRSCRIASKLSTFNPKYSLYIIKFYVTWSCFAFYLLQFIRHCPLPAPALLARFTTMEHTVFPYEEREQCKYYTSSQNLQHPSYRMVHTRLADQTLMDRLLFRSVNNGSMPQRTCRSRCRTCFGELI
jgi:hypothetical protein